MTRRNAATDGSTAIDKSTAAATDESTASATDELIAADAIIIIRTVAP